MNKSLLLSTNQKFALRVQNNTFVGVKSSTPHRWTGMRHMSEEVVVVAPSEDSEGDLIEDEAPDFWQRIQQWTRQEHDGQWLSISVFIAVALLGAALITQAQVIPGYKINPLLEDSNLVDIAWNEDGSSALAIIDGDAGYSIVKIDGNSETEVLKNVANSVERVEDGWIVGGDNGWLASCKDPCETLATKSFSEQGGESGHWTNNTEGQSIIDIVSDDGTSGLLLISDENNEATVRYFDSDKISAPADTLDIDVSLESMSELPDGEIIAVGNLVSKYPTWAEGDKNPASLPTRGVIVAIDLYENNVLNDFANVANNSESNETAEMTSDSMKVEMVLVHIGDNGKYHSIMSDSSSDGIAIIAGTGGAMRLAADMSVTSVEGAPGSTSAVADNNGDIWFAGDLNLERLGLLEAGEKIGETVEVPQGATFDSELAVVAGEEVHFHGASKGERVTLDPNVRDSMQSLSVLGDILFVVVSLVILSMMAWNMYDNWHLGGW